MTIRDMLDAGINIQGKVIVQKWNEKTENNDIYLDSLDFEVERHGVDCLEREVTYLYQNDTSLIIEVK